MTNFRWRRAVLILTTFLSVGCVSTKDRVMNIKRGMGAKQVQEILGTASNRTLRGEQELWAYEGASWGKLNVIVFQNGKVTDILDSLPEQASHSLVSADINNSENQSQACAGKNNDGKFAEGGGYGLYGCWPAGGSCNSFSCTSQGVCTVSGCPNKIPSYRCKN